MLEFSTLEASIDPTNKLTFLLDWELNLKCNLDCSYCVSGHNNQTKHPPLNECLDTIDFMYEYATIHAQQRPNSLKYVVLNVYGGEALFHPNIEEILKNVKEKYKKHSDSWSLTVSTTTNLSITKNKLSKIIDYIDEITCSFHAESTDKHKKYFKENLLFLKERNKSFKVIILMHSDNNLFHECIDMINWCKENNIRYLPRQLDHFGNEKFFYSAEQKNWFDNLYNQRSKNSKIIMLSQTSNNNEEDLANLGRSCCGGRLLSADQNYKNHISYVHNKFSGWSCSVSHFFLYVKQVTKEVFNNKDCRINFQNLPGPIGTLENRDKILKDAREFASAEQNSGITCVNERCFCGLCAPKAETPELYNKIMKKYFI